mmetsp:Transcript_78911/g.92234  ORF Transcript_78911/g.92234 Transcript_78911/m.92234 type:complete len:284 (-) Transcript_78911:300-1151(-)
MQQRFSDATRSLKSFFNFQKRWGKPQVALLRVSGDIDCNQVYNFTKSLQNVSKDRTQCLAVLVNSVGGAPGQCHILAQKLKIFSENTNIPVYTFAEDAATSGGFYILAAGDKIYADNTSLLGGIGASTRQTSAKKLVEHWGITIFKHVTPTGAPETFNHSILDDISAKDNALSQKIAEDTRKKFIEYTKTRFSNKLTIPYDKQDELLFEGDVFTGKKAKEYGIVDGLGNSLTLISQMFPQAKIVRANRLTLKQRVEYLASLFLVSSYNAVFWKKYFAPRNLKD